ncbi:MAG: hypothetical protein R6X34_05840 [Chloroflexota bacterium]
MVEYITAYKDRLLKEIDATPEEYLPALLNIVRSYRQSVSLNPADESFRQGWREAVQGETFPLESLWEDIDAE